MDYWGGEGGQRVCWPHPLKLLGGLGPPWPPSSYAYDLNPKKKQRVCVCGGGGGGGGGEGGRCCVCGGRCWKHNCFLGGGGGIRVSS